MGHKEFWRAGALTAALAFAAPGFAGDRADALLKDPNGKEVGKVTLIAVPSGILIDANLTAIPPGDHGFHIHEIGKCEPPDFTSAGGHFNPEEDKHGLLNKAGPHAGDLPNIHVPENGELRVEMLNPLVSLEGLRDKDGAAMVMHEGPDDYRTDPAGNAGARIACGVITK
jgi:superoxide dismutase, Cu-Zn family